MIKIELTHEVEEWHMDYFEEQILPGLIASRKEQRPINTGRIGILQINNGSFESKFSRQHYYFLGYIKNRYKLFAIGRQFELEEIHREMVEFFPLVMKMLESDEQNSAKLYKKYLYKLFGYEKFKVKDMYYYIKQRAKKNLVKEQYDEEVHDEMVKILKVNFPNQIESIDSELGRGVKKKFTEVMCEKAFRELRNCDITMGNFRHSEIFGDEWNDYRFVMESGLRVCPYCNRQYITPIYSYHGKMRADIDHFMPKSIYPYFSMSLYNLVPSCKSCNQSLKRDQKFNFGNISPYEDNISDYFKFRADVQTSEIMIKTSDTQPAIMQHIDTFKIGPLYNYHRNQVDELIEKRLRYPEELIQRLYEENKSYYNSIHDVKQLIIGFIDDKSKLNNEAFLKLRRDLAEQLGFLNTPSEFRIAELKRIIGNRR